MPQLLVQCKLTELVQKRYAIILPPPREKPVAHLAPAQEHVLKRRATEVVRVTCIPPSRYPGRGRPTLPPPVGKQEGGNLGAALTQPAHP